MNDKEFRAVVERVILSELAKIGEPYVPVYEGRKASSEELQKIALEVQARIYALEEAAE